MIGEVNRKGWGDVKGAGFRSKLQIGGWKKREAGLLVWNP